MIGSRPQDGPCESIFGGVSSGTSVVADGLHMISHWRKAYLQYESLSDLHFQSLPPFSRSFWPLFVSGFLCFVGMFKSVRMSALFVSGFLGSVGMFKSVRLGALFCQTLSVEAHENKIRAI